MAYERYFFRNKVIVKVGDITEEEVDAIVNAANSSLMGGGGVDGAIHRKGGPKILDECKEIRRTKYPDGLPTGEAVATTGGNLKAKYVIHTVGPIWRGGNYGEEELLKKCYINSIKVAEELGCKTIAFPAISTGVYGYPKEKSAEVVSKTLLEILPSTKLEEIRLVFFSKSDYDIFLEVAEKAWSK
jgi:O-acetyl-ADP-ribose deacetylase (regulator of RNase III)